MKTAKSILISAVFILAVTSGCYFVSAIWPDIPTGEMLEGLSGENKIKLGFLFGGSSLVLGLILYVVPRLERKNEENVEKES